MHDLQLFDNMGQTLIKMEKLFGPEIFEDPRRFISGLNDIVSPEEKTLKNLLRIAICELGAYERLKKSFEQGNSLAWRHLEKELSRDYLIPPDISEDVIECIAIFVGFPPESYSDTMPQEISETYTMTSLVPKPISKPLNLPPQAIIVAALHSHTLHNPARGTSFNNTTDISGPSKDIWAKPKIGETMQFGGCEWRILDIIQDRALLLSDRIIEERRYHDKDGGTSWANCDLRKYLNGTFYNKFRQNEKARIIKENRKNPNNPWFGTSGGADTIDKVFLLGIEEILLYLGDIGQIRKKPSNAGHISDRYNNVRIAKNQQGGISWWWLSSPGSTPNRCAFVSARGEIFVFGGIAAGGKGGGVRPALWLKV